MKHICKGMFIWVSLLALLATAPSVKARAESEDQLIAKLSSRDGDVVVSSLQKLEKKFPTSTKAFPVMKKLLTDSRMEVKRKAARVLGVLHAEVSEDDIKAICALLTVPDAKAQTDGLKALRGLKAPQAVPDILPLLKNSNTHLIRDACRTLAVLGNKDLVPTIQPLLTHPDPAVQKDAQDAITALQSKS